MCCSKALILNPLGFFFVLVNREWPIRSGTANDCFLGNICSELSSKMTFCYAKHGDSNFWFWEWSNIHMLRSAAKVAPVLIGLTSISFINMPINSIFSFIIRRYRPNVRTFLGTSLGSTCKHANVTCPGGKTTYPVTCSLGCPQYYSIKGASTITCQTSGQWTSYASSYCRRNNDPPSQVTFCKNSRFKSTDNSN